MIGCMTGYRFGIAMYISGYPCSIAKSPLYLGSTSTTVVTVSELIAKGPLGIMPWDSSGIGDLKTVKPLEQLSDSRRCKRALMDPSKK